MFRMWKKTYRLINDIRIGEDGATVVETTFIVPMIWVMIMGSILLFFFFFDMGVIRSETIRCAREVSREWRQYGKNPGSRQEDLLRKRIRERLLLANLYSSDLTVALGTVTVKADIRFGLGGKGLSFTDTSKVAVDNREDWGRLLAH